MRTVMKKWNQTEFSTTNIVSCTDHACSWTSSLNPLRSSNSTMNFVMCICTGGGRGVGGRGEWRGGEGS